MNQIIDLIPYLPQQLPQEKHERRRKFFSDIAAVIESAITLLIGAGFFVMLVAFFAAMA